ncbi:hypothetical protein J2S21_000848 [Peribacillus cavernae]|nr:hypothetical protein [Peribacillus cavernae]
MSSNDFNFEKLFRNAESFFLKDPSKDIKYPKGSNLNHFYRSRSIIGNVLFMQELITKHFSMKK